MYTTQSRNANDDMPRHINCQHHQAVTTPASLPVTTSGKKHQQSREMWPVVQGAEGRWPQVVLESERGREWAVAAAAAPCTAEVAAGLE
jgi:hypothetical protein